MKLNNLKWKTKFFSPTPLHYTPSKKIFENFNKNKSLKLNDLKWEDKILSPTPTTRQSPGLVVNSLKLQFKKSLKIKIKRNPWN